MLHKVHGYFKYSFFCFILCFVLTCLPPQTLYIEALSNVAIPGGGNYGEMRP